jgi:Transglycosylase SLT domain
MRLPALFLSVLAASPAVASTDPVDLRVMVRTEALKRGLPAQIADAVATVESNYRVSAIGDVGEIGLMQVLPSTARMLGFLGTNTELADPVINIRYGVDYLATAWKLANEDICTTVMKYRAGHGETRFSHKSVAYCVRVRAVLTEQGYPVRGEVPKATFGDPAPVLASSGSGGRAAKSRSRINWAAYDRRIKAIQSRITAADLTIMR